MIFKKKNKDIKSVHQMRKYNGRLKKFNHIRYPVSKELIDQYERTFGVAKQFIPRTKPGVNILKPKEKLSPVQPLVKTIIQKSCYTYYNKETLKHKLIRTS